MLRQVGILVSKQKCQGKSPGDDVVNVWQLNTLGANLNLMFSQSIVTLSLEKPFKKNPITHPAFAQPKVDMFFPKD